MLKTAQEAGSRAKKKNQAPGRKKQNTAICAAPRYSNNQKSRAVIYSISTRQARGTPSQEWLTNDDSARPACDGEERISAVQNLMKRLCSIR
jgi:hypothetical protein